MLLKSTLITAPGRLSMNSSLLTPTSEKKQDNLSACPLRGPPTAKPCSLASPTMHSASGPSQHKYGVGDDLPAVFYSTCIKYDLVHVLWLEISSIGTISQCVFYGYVLYYTTAKFASARLRFRSTESHRSSPPKSIFIPKQILLN